MQFYVFKKSVCSRNLLNDENENVKKVKNFLEESQEEVLCLRYNKCLVLVPESRRSIMETFQHWQPAVVLELIEEMPPKRRKIKASALDIEQPQSYFEVVKIEAVQKQENTLYDPEDPERQNITSQDEAWIEMQLENQEIVETEYGAEVVTWNCVNCDPCECFMSQNEFRTHLELVHLNYDHQSVELLNEEHITEDESMLQEDESRMSEDDEPPAAPGTALTFETKEIVVQDLFDCNICRFTTTDRKEFTIHKKAHVDSKLFETARYGKLFCSECCYQFTTHPHYQAHLNGHQLYKIVAKASIYPVCKVCNVMFCDESFYDFHQEKHELGAEVHEMIPNEGKFLQYGHYREDLDEYDKFRFNSDTVKCGHCHKRFYDDEACRVHQLIFHINTLQCPIENRVFNGNQAMAIHMRNNHPELFGDDVKFACSVCKQEFETLHEKLKHMKTCDQKRFACTHCEKRFSQKCYLIAHLRVVNGQSNIVCEICQKICRDKEDYRIHIR